MTRGMFYYLPGITAASRDKILAAGLGYALGEGGHPSASMNPGPDKGSGVVFSMPGRGAAGPSLQAADKAVWEKIPGLEAWVGFDPAAPPRPADLERERIFEGYSVDLGDGQTWVVPVVREIRGTTVLPRSRKWDGVAWSDGEILPRYRQLFSDACKVWDRMTGGDAGTEIVAVTVDTDLAARALALNYRLGPAEISHLGLFDTRSESEALGAVLDLPMLRAIKKKLDSGIEGGPPGGRA